MTRGEIWWADLGPYRTQEQTGRRPVIVWQSDTLIRLLQSVLVVPLTTNLDRAKLAGTALIAASDGGLAADSVAPAFQMRAIPKKCLNARGSQPTDGADAALTREAARLIRNVMPANAGGYRTACDAGPLVYEQCAPVSYRTYFQFRTLPSPIQATAVSSRRVRVSSPLASVIHSTYSRRWLSLKPSKVASAFLFCLSAASK